MLDEESVARKGGGSLPSAPGELPMPSTRGLLRAAAAALTATALALSGAITRLDGAAFNTCCSPERKTCCGPAFDLLQYIESGNRPDLFRRSFP